MRNLNPKQFMRRRSVEHEPLLLDTFEQEEIIEKFRTDCARSDKFHRVCNIQQLTKIMPDNLTIYEPECS